MPTAILIITTVANFEDAKEIAEYLLKQQLCACVNILPKCYSIYHWQDSIEEAEEHMLLIKTTNEKYTDLQEAIKKLHKYELPEIIAIDIAKGLPEYLNWIEATIN